MKLDFFISARGTEVSATFKHWESLSLDWSSCKSFKAPYDVINQDVHLSVDNDEQIFS